MKTPSKRFQRPSGKGEPAIKDTSTPAVVLGCDTHGALGIVRSLGRLGVPVHCVHDNRRTPALLSRYCTQVHEWNPNSARSDETIDFLVRLGRSIGTRAVLIATSDIGAMLVAENAASLCEHFAFPSQEAALIKTLCSKREMYHLAKRHGVPVPESVFPTCFQDLKTYLETARFPLLLKATFSGIRGKTSITLVHSEAELLEIYERESDTAGNSLFVQEYIPGPDHLTWTFNGYFDANSQCSVTFTGRKLRNYRPRLGVASLGECVINDIVRETTLRFMQNIGYSGCLDLGYRFDTRDGLYKVNDVNPRVGAMFRCFVGENGMDVVRALYQDLTGQKVTPSATKEGRRWIVEDTDLVSSFHDWSTGLLSVREWLASLKGIEETAYIALDDMRPLLGVVSSAAQRIGRRSSPR